jgi:hypothetical protein
MTDRQTDRRHKPECENEDVTALRIEGLHTEREIMANRPDIIKVINNKIIKRRAYRKMWQYQRTEMSRKRKQKRK